MSQVSEQQGAIPAGAAICLLLPGATSGHALSGVVCAMAVFLGLGLRARPGQRALGNALALSGALGFCLGLLFTTGYSLGKDMARRDSGISSVEINVPAHGA